MPSGPQRPSSRLSRSVLTNADSDPTRTTVTSAVGHRLSVQYVHHVHTDEYYSTRNRYKVSHWSPGSCVPTAPTVIVIIAPGSCILGRLTMNVGKKDGCPALSFSFSAVYLQHAGTFFFYTCHKFVTICLPLLPSEFRLLWVQFSHHR